MSFQKSCCLRELHRRARTFTFLKKGYDPRMKTTYIFAAILICSLAGTVVSGRSVKNAFLLLSGALSIYGLVRILG